MRLPVIKVLVGAFVLVLERRHSLFERLWMPAGIGIFLSVYQHFAVTESSQNFLQFGITVAVFLLTIILAVRSYNIFLDPASENKVAPISWTRRESRFLVTMVIISFGFGFLTLLAGLIIGSFMLNRDNIGGPFFASLFFIPGAYLASRVLLAFPLISIREISIPDALRGAWGLSQNNVLGILILCIGTPAILAVLFAFSSNVQGLAVISVVLPWVTMPLEFSVIALVFSQLERHAGENGINQISR